MYDDGSDVGPANLPKIASKCPSDKLIVSGGMISLLASGLPHVGAGFRDGSKRKGNITGGLHSHLSDISKGSLVPADPNGDGSFDKAHKLGGLAHHCL